MTRRRPPTRKAALVGLGLLGVVLPFAPATSADDDDDDERSEAPPPGTPAPDPPRPVAVEANPLFGPELMLVGEVVPIQVSLTERGGARREGRLTLAERGLIGTGVGADRGVARHVVDVVVPAHGRRTVVLPVIPTPTHGLEARFVDEGGELLGQSPRQGLVGHRNGRRSILLLPDDTGIRLALERLRAGAPPATPSHRGSAPMPTHPGPAAAEGGPAFRSTVVLGGVPLDPTTGDPAIPSDPRAWAVADLIIAQTDALGRLPAAHRAALLDLVRLGGRLALIPSGGAGDLNRADLQPFTSGGVDEPATGGAERRVGRGVVWVLQDVDPDADDLEARLRAFVEHIEGPAPDEARWGRRRDAPWFGFPGRGGAGEVGAIPPDGRPMLALLDPNRRYRQGLALVAIALLLYTVMLAPVGLGRGAKGRRRPLGALWLTPLLATGVTGLVLAVALFGKGARSRSETVTLVDATAGERTAAYRRYLGLFPTLPTRFDLPAPSGSLPEIPGDPDRAAAPRAVLHGVDTPVLAGIRAGLWETRFFREDGALSLPAAVELTPDDATGAAVAVRNQLPDPLLGAVVIQPTGDVIALGRIPPGGEVRVEGRPSSLSMRHGLAGDRNARRDLGRLLDLPGGHAPEAVVDALLAQSGYDEPLGIRIPLTSPPGAVLLARWPGGEGRPVVPEPAQRRLEEAGFPVATEARFLRVATGPVPLPPLPPAPPMEAPDDATLPPELVGPLPEASP